MPINLFLFKRNTFIKSLLGFMIKFLKIILPIFILIYCLIIIPIILYYYSIYLNRPNNDTWNQVEKYLIEPGKYNNEPIVFSPGWLKGYATDWGRFQKFNITETNSSFYTYWLITMNRESISKNYQIISSQEIDNLFIIKLEKVF